MQVHPVVNLVRDFDPMDNLELGQLALFNVRAALHAARQSEAAPIHPSRTSGTCNWDTLTYPSGVTSDDGSHGRSHPVAGTADAADGAGPHMPAPGRAVPVNGRSAARNSPESVVTGVTDNFAHEHRSVSQPGSP